MVVRAPRVVTWLLAACVAAGCAMPTDAAPERAAPATTTAGSASSTTASVPVTTADPTTSAPAPATTAAPTTTAVPFAPARVARPWTLAPYAGMGAWLDAFDWSVSFARSEADTVGLAAIDDMAAQGVQTLYIQASRWNSPTDVLEPDRLRALIDRAHAQGIAVVAWYLPTLVDPETDLRRMLALAALDIDGLGVDIEARDVEDVAERNRRLVDLSARLDAALGDRPLAAIVMEPVLMEDVNPQFWPGYPWAELAPHYDVWMPMSYWTNRRDAWRNSYDYTAENIRRVRARIGDPSALVHTIGGIGDRTTVGDLSGMVQAAVEQGAIGGSMYDYRTTAPEHWGVLRAFRAG